MKALVVGSGGREHAIAYALKKSPLVDRLFWTPGNAAAEEIAENPRIGSEDLASLVKFVRQERIELTVVGPEAPLVKGIADLFEEERLPLFGPVGAGAMIEGSKVFAKQLMEEAGIPTAGYALFSDASAALGYLKTKQPPYVIKADGLAGGKGVSIVRSLEDAQKIFTDLFEKRIFGKSGERVVIEEFLSGEEATVLALCDGTNVIPLIPSQDHKPVYDGDRGPNTGGMGAFAPAPVVNEAVMGKVMNRVLLPLVQALKKRGIRYRGVIYAGLMVKAGEPYVVEFNCRLGDPEAEAVLPLLKTDIAELFLSSINDGLDKCSVQWISGYACDVVIASGGYPGGYAKGKEIRGLEELRSEQDLIVYHAGTKREGNRTLTDGGRVLNVVGIGGSLRKAVERAYEGVGRITFENMHFRRDIGFRGLSRLL